MSPVRVAVVQAAPIAFDRESTLQKVRALTAEAAGWTCANELHAVAVSSTTASPAIIGSDVLRGRTTGPADCGTESAPREGGLLSVYRQARPLPALCIT